MRGAGPAPRCPPCATWARPSRTRPTTTPKAAPSPLTSAARPTWPRTTDSGPTPFQRSCAAQAAAHGATPLVQLDPEKISLTAIADGQFDPYLKKFAAAVK